MPLGEIPRHRRRLLAAGETRASLSLQVVQTVAQRPQRRLVVLAVDGDGAGRPLNRCGGPGERDYRPSLQQPDEPDLVVAGQASVARVRLGRGLVEAEQVPGRPAEGVRLVAPAG